MKPDGPVTIVLFTVTALSIVGTSYSCITFYQRAQKSTYAQLLYFLIFTATLESIFSLPLVYTRDMMLCRATGWLHTYFSLANMISTTLLTLYHMNNVYSTDLSLSGFIVKWNKVLIFMCPLLTIFGFFGDGYEVDHEYWCGCVIETPRALAWGIAVYYVWIWLALLLNLFVLGKVFFAAQRLEISSRSILFSTVGQITFVAVAIWIPLTVRRFYSLADDTPWSAQEYGLLSLPFDLSGMFYTLMLQYDRSALDIDDPQWEPSSQSLAGFEFDWAEVLPSLSFSSTLAQTVGGDSSRSGATGSSGASSNIDSSIALNPIVRSAMQQKPFQPPLQNEL